LNKALVHESVIKWWEFRGRCTTWEQNLFNNINTFWKWCERRRNFAQAALVQHSSWLNPVKMHLKIQNFGFTKAFVPKGW